MLVALPHGFTYAYAIDGTLFTAALYSALRLPSLPPDGKAPRLGLRSVVEGLQFIATRPVLMMSFGVDIAAMVLAMPRALFPAVADTRFDGNVGPALRRHRDRGGDRRAVQRLDQPGPPPGTGA